MSLRSWWVLLASASWVVAVAQEVPPPRPERDPGEPAPRPRFERNPLYPTPVVLYGRISLGPGKPDTAEPLAEADKSGLLTLERSHIGIRGVETLDRGVQALFTIEHSLNASNGEADPCNSTAAKRFFDAQATVGLADRDAGRLELGLKEQPALVLLRRADPWGGNTEATPGRRAYLPPSKCAVRSADAITYATPDQWDWQASLQAGRPEPTAEQSSYRGGGSFAWDRKPWLAGVGWQEWNDGSYALPIVLVHDAGTLSLRGAFTLGRAQHDRYHNVFIGASGYIMKKGDPQRSEWRVGLNHFSRDRPRESEFKAAAGWRYRLSPRVALLADAAAMLPRRGSTTLAVDFGISYSFARDLRWPQEPR